MKARFPSVVGALFAAASVTITAVPPAQAQGQDELRLNDVPKVVMGALMARFPKADIRQWDREEEDGMIVYDFEFLQDGRKFEADIREDGSIHNWESAVAYVDLPEAVKQTVESKFPDATITEVMAITAVEGQRESLEGFEIVLATAEDETVEITVAPDGGILEEDSGDGS